MNASIRILRQVGLDKYINKRINELETSIELLKAIRQDFVENNKEEIFIKALNDGINYTTQRLEKYKTTEWIMTID